MHNNLPLDDQCYVLANLEYIAHVVSKVFIKIVYCVFFFSGGGNHGLKPEELAVFDVSVRIRVCVWVCILRL